MAQFHFVEDYEAYVRKLLKDMPRKQAMEEAIGGAFDHVGEIEAQLLGYAGLKDGMYLVDLGCGSGRAASALGKRFEIDYLGLDVVQDLLDYASEISPPNYRFQLNHALTLPVADASVDMFCCFSVFTHLLHSETYLYLEEMARALTPDGRIVFSFLEFLQPGHWAVFNGTVEGQRTSQVPHLNMFIERGAIEAWCKRLGLEIVRFVDGTDGSPWGGAPLGQSIAILALGEKRKARPFSPAEHDRLRAQLATKTQAIESMATELDLARAEIDVLKQSRSWRVTAPLRALRRVLG